MDDLDMVGRRCVVNGTAPVSAVGLGVRPASLSMAGGWRAAAMDRPAAAEFKRQEFDLRLGYRLAITCGFHCEGELG